MPGPEVHARDGVIGERNFHGRRSREYLGALVEHQRDGNQSCQESDGVGPAPRTIFSEGEFVQHDHARQNHRAFLRKDSDGRHRRQSRNVREPAPACRIHAPQIQQKAAEHRPGGQQVRTPHDVRDGLRQHGMHGPQSGHEKRRPETAHEPDGQSINQQHVARMQHEVEPVIAARSLAVAQNRVVEEVRQGRERAVKATLAIWPPVSVMQDQLNVGG